MWNPMLYYEGYKPKIYIRYLIGVLEVLGNG